VGFSVTFLAMKIINKQTVVQTVPVGDSSISLEKTRLCKIGKTYCEDL